ncbi:MAG: molecular chaperone HtpG [Oscillospiraceae bacterium]|nr:molecular chaperone HtpG [Oscillospiraceae bacterium]
MAKKQFKAESKRLLDLMINSIYTHKEIFLREIVSNASDAIDKMAYLALTDDKIGLNRSDFAIQISVDEPHRTITVSDNGIGMSKQEMEENLGTIAKSGSLQFKQEMEKQDDVDIIGQFGVGFYSAFMIAEAVTVISKKYGSEEAWMWQSAGADGYTMTPCEKETVGTDVIMCLKKDTDDEKYAEYLQTYRLQQLITKYSNYIRYPIKMEMDKQVPKEGGDPEKHEMETVTENKTLNSMVPIWQRAKSELQDADYNSFYAGTFYDPEEPISHIHISVEGGITYKALLYIPAKMPMDYNTLDYKRGLQLYSSGVMIMDCCPDLIPEYFQFVRGVVDSQDLSLNISREMLQHDRQLQLIAANLEKKIKAELERLMKNDRARYEKFYSAFGQPLKYGLLSDFGAHKDVLQDLVMFYSAKQDKMVSLREYVDAMAQDQKHIYFVSGPSRSRLAKLPQTEQVLGKGCDVLYFTDEMDEFVVQSLHGYAEKQFKSVMAADLELPGEAEEKPDESAYKPTLDFIKETLGERVKDVRMSQNLGEHPVSIVPDTGMSFEMERYLKRIGNPYGESSAGRIMELNANHPAFAALQLASAQDPEKAKKYVEVLYSQGLLMANLPLEDPTAYTDLVCSLIG